MTAIRQVGTERQSFDFLWKARAGQTARWIKQNTAEPGRFS